MAVDFYLQLTTYTTFSRFESRNMKLYMHEKLVLIND